MRPFDSVVLTEDLSDKLRAGTEGTIVDQYQPATNVYMVELFDGEGNTLDVVDVRADQMLVTLADFFDGERIALLVDLPKHKLRRGQVGTIQERVAVGLYAVEFADIEGTAYARLNLHAGQMMLLHWQPAEAKQSA
jgi:hypothetical protein